MALDKTLHPRPPGNPPGKIPDLAFSHSLAPKLPLLAAAEIGSVGFCSIHLTDGSREALHLFTARRC
jgi:hypothetical protein